MFFPVSDGVADDNPPDGYMEKLNNEVKNTS